MKLFLAALITLSASFSLAGVPDLAVCATPEQQEEAIETFVTENFGQATLSIYPRGESKYGIRFYPGDMNCLGEVAVTPDCVVIDAGQDVFTIDGLQKQDITCWVPSNEQG